jgi:hypothetical protein
MILALGVLVYGMHADRAVVVNNSSQAQTVICRAGSSDTIVKGSLLGGLGEGGHFYLNGTPPGPPLLYI